MLQYFFQAQPVCLSSLYLISHIHYLLSFICLSINVNLLHKYRSEVLYKSTSPVVS